MEIADFSLTQLAKVVEANPQVPWADFCCTPVAEVGVGGKISAATKRCAITAEEMSVVVRMPHETPCGRGSAWPPQLVLNTIMEAMPA
jgi:hypothetical protein